MLDDLRYRIRAILGRDALEAELDDELRAHLDVHVDRYLRDGLTRADAERRARLDLGGVEQVKEACRDSRGVSLFEEVVADIRYGWRGLRRDALFATVAVVMIALGAGAAATVFSVVDGILLKPLPYPDADRIVFLWHRPPSGIDAGAEELPWGRLDFQALASDNRAFEAAGAFQQGAFNLTGAGEPVRLDGALVSSGFFAALGTTPALGRVFTADEDRPGHDREVVLSDRVWRERFNGDPAVVGRSIDLNGEAFAIIGVMPRGFGFPRASELPASFAMPREAQVWVPLALPPGPQKRGEPRELAVVARLRPGVTLRAAQGDVDAYARRMDRAVPAGKGWFDAEARPMVRQIVGDTREPLLLLFAAVLVVLLIVAANLSHLLLARSLRRETEFAIRHALGASRRRLIQQIVTETVLVAALGGVLAFVVADAGVAFVRHFGPSNIPRLAGIELSTRVVLFLAAVSALSGLFIGLLPAMAVDRGHGQSSLYEGRSTATARTVRLRDALLVGEIAVALVLVVACALLVRTFVALLRVDGGYRADHVLTFEVTLPPATYPDVDRIVAVYRNALARLGGLPGVGAAGLGETLPMGGAGESTAVRLPDHPAARPGDRPIVAYTIVSPKYFAALGTGLVRGRYFDEHDTGDSRPVAIINDAMARQFWPHQDVLEKRVGVPIDPFDMAIVGVVADVKHQSLREKAVPEVYVPFTQKVWPSMQTMHFAIRTAGDPTVMTEAVRRTLAAIDPGLAMASVATLDALVGESIAPPRFATLAVASFTAIALVLACIGLYGAAAYGVSQRVQEIGIRVALGASRSSILELVMRRGLLMTAAGLAIGTAAAAVVAQTMRRFLFGVAPIDTATFAGAVVLIVAVGLMATYLPARRAAALDPLTALRRE